MATESPSQWFAIAQWSTLVVPIALTGVIFMLPRPRRAWLRAPLAILVGWIAAVLLTAFVYNPAGIAYGHAIGEHLPENRFDNNTVASAILGGWIYPALMCAVMAAVRFARLRLGRSAPRER